MNNKILSLSLLLNILCCYAMGQQVLEAVNLSLGDVKVDANFPTKKFPGEALQISSDSLYQPTSEAYLQFSIDYLPPNAKITECVLQLSIAQKVQGSQGSRLFAVKPGTAWSPDKITWNTKPATADTSLAAKFITDVDTMVEYTIGDASVIKAMTHSANGKNTIGLKITSDSWMSKVIFHSQGTAAATGIYRLSPRLIFKYYVSPEPRINSGWEQVQNNPQHNGQSKWNAHSAPQKFNPDILYKPTGSISGFPIVDNRNVYVKYQTTGNNESLIKLNLQKDKLWSYALDDNTLNPLILDAHGNVLLVQASTKTSIGDFIIIVSPEGKLVKKIPLKRRLAAMPVLGLDNTMYLADSMEVTALGNPPSYDTLWNHKHPCNISESSQVALSPDEKNVLIIRGSSLLNLDKVSGTLVSKVDLTYPYSLYKEPIAGPNGNNITVTVGNNNAQISIIQNGELQHKIPGSRISGAAINTNNNSLYAVKDHMLCQIDITSGKILNQSAEKDLSVNSPLIINNSGQIYFTAEDNSGTNYIYGYDKSCKQFLKTDVNTYRINTNLIMGGDGTLYSANDNTLYQFFPESKSNTPLTITQTLVNNAGNTTLRGSDIKVEGVQIDKDGNYFIQSNQGIGLQKGFRVAKGASVIFSVGY